MRISGMSKAPGALVALFLGAFFFPVSAQDRNTIAGPTAHEIEQLEKLKDRTQNRDDYQTGSKAGHVDYITLFQGEDYDEAWAPVAEHSIAQKLAALPLEQYGLSKPVVQCATNVCEIMVVQKYSGTENLSTNWQTLFVKTTKSEAFGVPVADSMMLMTNLDSEKTGFVAYVLVDRAAADLDWSSRREF